MNSALLFSMSVRGLWFNLEEISKARTKKYSYIVRGCTLSFNNLGSSKTY